MLNRKTPPSYNLNAEIHLPTPQKQALSNGIEVYYFNSGNQDIVLIELIIEAGSKYQTKPFTAMATNIMLREGTKRYTAQALADEIDFYGAQLECTTERDNAFVSLYSLTKHLDKMLPILNEIVRYPTFPKTELNIIAEKQKQQLEINKEKVSFLARTYFNRLIFGENHFYGKVLEPEEMLDVNAHDLQSFHKKQYHAKNCKIIVAGKIPDYLPDLLNETLGQPWEGEKAQQPAQNILPHSEKLNFIVKPDAKQSAIRMGKVLVNRQHPDFLGLKVLNTLLGGYFGSRLMMNLREDKGYTYGVGSGTVPLLQEGYQIIASEVGREVTQKAYSEICNELMRLCDNPVPEHELALVRNYMMGDFMRSLDGPLAQASVFRELIESEMGMDFLTDFKNTIHTIDAKTLQALAQKYYTPESFHTLIVGAEKF